MLHVQVEAAEAVAALGVAEAQLALLAKIRCLALSTFDRLAPLALPPPVATRGRAGVRQRVSAVRPELLWQRPRRRAAAGAVAPPLWRGANLLSCPAGGKRTGRTAGRCRSARSARGTLPALSRQVKQRPRHQIQNICLLVFQHQSGPC